MSFKNINQWILEIDSYFFSSWTGRKHSAKTFCGSCFADFINIVIQILFKYLWFVPELTLQSQQSLYLVFQATRPTDNQTGGISSDINLSNSDEPTSLHSPFFDFLRRSISHSSQTSSQENKKDLNFGTTLDAVLIVRWKVSYCLFTKVIENWMYSFSSPKIQSFANLSTR